MKTLPSSFFLAIVFAVTAAAQQPPLPSVKLPSELDRVLRDYERAWQARDASALAALFTEDGFVLSNGRPPVRGRAKIQERYSHSGGPLSLRALAFETNGSTGYIIGAYGATATSEDDGKFVLALRRGRDRRWMIAADIDNSNRRPTPPSSPPAPPGQR